MNVRPSPGTMIIGTQGVNTPGAVGFGTAEIFSGISAQQAVSCAISLFHKCLKAAGSIERTVAFPTTSCGSVP